MMLFSKTSTGVEISQTGVVIATVGGSNAAPRLLNVATAPFESGVIKTALREPNILNPDKFVSTLNNTSNLMLQRSGRVSISLPDSAGRVMLVDMEGRFKSRKEALDLIRWKLKKNMPFESADTHLDYQLLTVRENGSLALMVALMSRKVIEQYEALIVQAGLVPAAVDFTTFSLCHLFEQRLGLQDDCLLISFFGNTLSVITFVQGIPEFIRIKELSNSSAIDSRLFMEINNSLLVSRERLPDFVPASVYYIAAPDMARPFGEMVGEAAGQVANLLEAKTVVTPADSAPADQARLYVCSAAIGAALRNL